MYRPPEPKSNFDDVGEFHHKFELDNVTHNDSGPRDIPDDLLLFRCKFMLEELAELFEALGVGMEMEDSGETKIFKLDKPIDHAKAFDALLDEAYVTFGFAHLMGYPWQVGWNAVQHANMRKVRAERAEQSERGGTWDVVKPDGWKPPDIAAVLYAHGFDISGYAMPTDPQEHDK